MENKIEKILQELYLIDPGLKKEEAILSELLRKLIQSRPRIVIDSAFVNSLRNMLLERANEKASQKLSLRPFLYNRYAVMGAFAVVILLVFSSVLPINQTGQQVYTVNELNEEAFGPLEIGSLSTDGSNLTTANNALLSGKTGTVNTANDMAKGGESMGMTFSQSSQLGIGGSGGGMNGSVPPSTINIGVDPYPPGFGFYPEYKYPLYVYEGEKFDVDAWGYVYKRKPVKINSDLISGILKKLPVKNLVGTDVDSVTLTENRDFGYSISISFKEGMVSFYQNLDKWPYPTFDGECLPSSGQECLLVQPQDSPMNLSDSEALTIADGFLKEYGIDLRNYGPGQVKTISGVMPMSASETDVSNKTNVISDMPFYQADTLVTYPLLINGLTVYDEWGNPVGIYVTVSSAFKKVTSAYGISMQNYDSSRYPLEQDTQKIISLAEQGGMGGIISYDYGYNNVNTTKIGTPRIGLMQTVLLSDEGQTSSIMYVPALVFPIIGIENNYQFNGNNVLVPLVPEVINKLQNRFKNIQLPGPRPELPPGVEMEVDI